jgi:hypothetical protein
VDILVVAAILLASALVGLAGARALLWVILFLLLRPDAR